jgi:hypothetical protein
LSGLEIASTLLSILGKSVAPFLQKLLDLGIVVHKGATIYHKDSEIEYQLHINFGSITTRMQSITHHIQSYIVNKSEFDEVIDVWGYGLQNNENLKELQIIQISGSIATIDFGRIMKEIKSDLVIITIRKNLSSELLQKLLINHINQNPLHTGDKYSSADIEVALDYANLWYKSFDQFTIRNIEFYFDLEINLQTIISTIPKSQKDRIIQVGKSLLSGNKDAISFMRIMSDNFLSFQKEPIVNALKETVILEPQNNFQLLSVIPKMKTYEFAKFGHPVVLPGSMRINVACRIEGKDIVLKGKLGVDFSKFKKILISIMNQIEKESKNLAI